MQAASHTNPIAPRRTKAACQPQFTAIQGTTSGVKTAPIFAPELNIPVASARSLRGNHSVTALTAAGELPASPNPSAKRATPNPITLWASPCAAQAALQRATDNEYPARAPSRSMSEPNASNPIM